MRRIMTPRCALACSLALSFLLALAGCGSSGGGGGGRAVATYCPLPYSQALPAAVAGANSPPRAYYQRLRVSLGDTLPVTLFACDPDLGSSYTGLTWAVTSGPVSGGQLSDQAGTYAGEPFQVTYTPSQAGTDRFFYQVNDGVTWGNTAEILITVDPPAVSTPTWAVSYGGAGVESEGGVLPTSDGGYSLLTITDSLGSGSWDILLMKLNADGTAAWQRTYGSSGEELPNLYQTTPDGGWVVAGRTNASGAGFYDAFVMKVNSDGSIAWQKTYGGAQWDWAADVVSLTDGTFIVVGDTDSYGFGSFNNELTLMKLDTDGTVLWSSVYRAPGSVEERPSALSPTADGGTVMAGRTASFGAGGQDAWVVKFAPDGSVQWQKTYGGTGDERFREIVQTPDGGYIVVGETGSFGAGGTDFWVLKLAADGSVQWQKAFGGAADDNAKNVLLTSDGGYLVAGETGSFGAGATDLWLLKLDGAGSTLWQRSYGGTGVDQSGRVYQGPSGDYFLAGETRSYGAGGGDTWLLRIDPYGRTGGPCGFGQTTLASSVDTAIAASSSTAAINSLFPSVADASAVAQTVSLSPGIQCSDGGPFNQAPSALPGSLDVTQDTVAFGTLAGSDPDSGPAPITFGIVANAVKGSAVIDDVNTGAYHYSPFAGQTGPDAFTFRVYDGQDYSQAATVSVNIRAFTPPTVSISGYPSAINEGAPGPFTGTVLSDPDGTGPYTYDWDFGDGGTGSGSPASHTYADGPNTYTVVLTVTNAQARTGTDSVTVDVVNVAPNAVATAGSTNTLVDTPVTFSGSLSSDAGSDVLFYGWNFGDGNTASGVSAIHSFTSPGTYTVVLTVTDDDAAAGSDAVVVTVSSASNTPPSPVIGAPSSAFEGDVVPVVVTINDPDGPTPYTYILNYDDGNNIAGTTSAGTISGQNTYVDNGTYLVLATVTDGASASSTASWLIDVLNVSPVASASADTLNTTVGQPVLFDGSGSSDAGSDVLVFSWDFGDFSAPTPFTTDPTAGHAYTAAGTYTVTLSVADDDGGSGTDQLTVNVSPGGPTVWYVDQNAIGGLQDGTSWANAFLHPQDAWDVAWDGDQVWVAAGNYAPLSTADPLVPVLSLVWNVEYYGGFNGTETSLDQRDWGANITVLNADADQTGPVPVAGSGDVYTVVYGGAGAVLDGFWVINGNSDTTGISEGMRGGGIFVPPLVDTTIRNCVVAWNVAVQQGGGMYLDVSDGVTVESTVFVGNRAASAGAGMGGAMYLGLATNTTVRHCYFDSNYAQWAGGAIGGQGSGPTRVTHSWFENNTAVGMPGGAYYGYNNDSVTFDSCLFTGNQSVSDSGGAIYMAPGAAGLEVVNSTFTLNTAAGPGAAVFSSATSVNLIRNSILWGDAALSVSDSVREVSGPVTVLYSDVDRGALAAYAGTGNINTDPAFADTTDFRIRVTSPCVDAGDNAGILSSLDLGGNPRPRDGDGDGSAVVDMGAWEWQLSPAARIFFRGDRPPTTLDELFSWDAVNGVSVLTSVTGGLVPSWLTAYDGRLYFNGYPEAGPGTQLMSWDHLSSTLSTHSNVSPQFLPRDLAVYNGRLFMTGFRPFVDGYELYSWDGSALLQVTGQPGGSVVTNVDMARAFGKLYYAGRDTGGNLNLWSYDSNASVTTRVSAAFLNPEFMVPFNDLLYVRGYNPANGADLLWSVDPFTGVATSLRDAGGGTNPWYLTPVNGRLYFSVMDSTGLRRQLMSWDPVDGFTQLSSFTVPGGLDPTELTPFEGSLFFRGNDGSDGTDQLFSYDEFNLLVQHTSSPGQLANPAGLVVHDGKLYFGAYDGSATPWIWAEDSAGNLATVPGSQNTLMSEPISLDPDNPPVADASGTWSFQETIGANDCGDPVGSVFPFRATVDQRGGTAVVQTEHGTVNFLFTGPSELTGRSVYPEAGGVTDETFSLTLSPDGGLVAGESSWTWTDTIITCSGGSYYQGLRD